MDPVTADYSFFAGALLVVGLFAAGGLLYRWHRRGGK